MTNKPTDWDLMWRDFKAGKMEAFHDIYIAFFGKLFAYGSRITSETDVLEDSIQELFLKLYTRRDKLANDVNLEFYLLKSLKFNIYQKLRKKGRMVLSGSVQEDAENSGFLFRTETDDYVNENEKSSELLAALATLDPKQRELLFLKFYNNLSYKEIGKILDIQPDSAKKQVYRIIKKLKDEFKPFSINLFVCVLQHVK